MRSAIPAVCAALLLGACGKSDPKPVAEGAAVANAPVVVADAAVAPAPKVDRLHGLPVMEVPPGVHVEAAADGPLAVVAMLQVVFEGAPVARVMGSHIDPKAIDGEPRRIVPLVSFYEAWMKSSAPNTAAAVNVAIVPQLGAGVLMDVLGSFAVAGKHDFGLVVRTADGAGVFPVKVPGEDARLSLVLTLDGDSAVLTRDGTKLVEVRRTARDAWPRLREAVVALAASARTTITVAVTDDISVRDLLAAIVAVRQDDRGAVLVGDVELMRHVPAPAPAIADNLAMQEDEARAFADLLTAEGDDGATAGDLTARRPGADLNAQLADVRDDGARVAIGGGGGGVRGGGTLGGGTGRGPTASDAPPATPSGRIQVSAKQAFDDSSLTADAVLMKIMSAYISGLKRCYKDFLKHEPTARGSMTLRFTVNETGRAIDGKVNTIDPDLAACAEGLITSWRFAIPKDPDGEAISAAFEIRLQLAPE